MRKVIMALSGLFLVIFLALHFTINITSVIDPHTFNQWSHFMGYNPLVQFALQPVLIAGVVIHFLMGFVLEAQNRSARGPQGYSQYKGSANAPWVSRNMLLTGGVVLAFLGLHFYDFWVHEMNYKYVEALPMDDTRYYFETVEKFEPFWRTVIYVASFGLLSLHLWHGFASSLQTMGVSNKYTPSLVRFAKIYALVIPIGFAFIAIYHHLSHLTH